MFDRRDLLVTGGLAAIGAVLPHGGVQAAPKPSQPLGGVSGAGAPRLLADLRSGRYGAAAKLLKRHPEMIYARSESDDTLFRILSRERLYAASDWLLGHGFLPDVFDLATAETAKRFDAAFKADPSIVSARDRFGRSPLHIAADAGSVAMVEALVGRGVTVDARSGSQMTALGVALSYPDPSLADEMSWILLANGADPDLEQSGGERPVHIATRNGNGASLAHLVRRRADLSARNSEGLTARAIAVARKDQACIDALADKRSVLRPRRGGETDPKTELNFGLPQNYVNQFVVFGHFSLTRIREMYARTPDLLTATASWDEIAIEGAAHLGFKDGASFLADKGAPISLPTAITLKQTQLAARILADTPNAVAQRGPHDYPVAWYPVFAGGDIGLAELLVSHGADMTETVRGQGALHLAASRNQGDFAAWLLTQGCNPKEASRVGFMPGTPAEIAARARHDGLARELRAAAARWQAS